MSVSEVQVWPLKKDHPKVKANAKFVLAGGFKINCTVMNGEKGLYVSLPGKYGDKIDEKTGKKVWYPDIIPITNEARAEMTQKVLEKYNQETGNTSGNQGEAPGPTDQTGGGSPNW